MRTRHAVQPLKHALTLLARNAGGLINSMMDRSASSPCLIRYRQGLRQLTEVRSDHGAGGRWPYARWRRTRQLAPADSSSVLAAVFQKAGARHADREGT